MKTIKINTPKGYEIDLEKSDLEKGIIEFKEINELPLSVKDLALIENTYHISNDGEVIKSCSKFIDDPNTIETKEMAEAFLALMQLIRLCNAWNKGKKGEYGIHNYGGIKVGLPLSDCNTPLKFVTSQLRNRFSIQFDELIQQALPLL